MTTAGLRAYWSELTRGTRVWIIACLLAGLGLFTSQLLEIPHRSALRGSDNSFNYFWLRSLMVGGDWSFRDDVEACNTLPPEYRAAALAVPLTPTGRQPNKYGVGWSLMSTPGYLVGDAIVAGGRALGVWELERDGYNAVYQISLQTWHLFLAAVALTLAYRVALRWCSREAALRGVMLLWATSPMLYYQTSNLSMSHGVTFLAIVTCVYGLVRAEDAPGRWWPWLLAGAGFGLAVVTRFQTAIFGVVPAFVWLSLVLKTRDPRAGAKAALGMICGALPLLVLQMFAWKTVYGSWLVYSYGVEKEPFYWTKPAFSEVLFSPKHGLFYWNPFLLAGVIGLFVLAWQRRGLAVISAVAVLIMIYVNAAWWCWWFGSSFGSRAFDGAFLFMMIGMAWLFQRLPARASQWLFAGGVVFAVWNLGLLLLYRMALIPRNDAVTYGDALRAFGKLFGGA